jgi:trehalose utilization protein
MAQSPLRVTVWGEYVHERENPAVGAVYPEGMHAVIAAGLRDRLGEAVEVRTATLGEPEHGLTNDVLQSTDVLTWWGHKAHGDVQDVVVDRVVDRIHCGMGLVVLHSGHESKLFRRLMGTTCSLRWRESDDREVVYCVNPGHPVAQGLPEAFVIPKQEMYGEYFDIPQPDELVFVSSFTGGEVFRSGCCFRRGAGSIFYFSPGHESYPVYYQREVQQVLANGVRWAANPAADRDRPLTNRESPLEWFENPSAVAR